MSCRAGSRGDLQGQDSQIPSQTSSPDSRRQALHATSRNSSYGGTNLEAGFPPRAQTPPPESLPQGFRRSSSGPLLDDSELFPKDANPEMAKALIRDTAASLARIKVRTVGKRCICKKRSHCAP